MTEPLNVEQAAARLQAAGSVLILCHKNPDGDTIGCGSALYHALTALGKTPSCAPTPSRPALLTPSPGCSGASSSRNWWWRWTWPGPSSLATRG